DYMVTARELTPYEHVDMQAAIQKYTDASVSKTVNAPSSYTEEDVANLYMYGYKKGLKGITVYVDGSREGVLNYLDKEDKKAEKEEPSKKEFAKRPQILAGHTIKMVTPVGKAYITVNVDDQNRIDEVFIKLGKTGADVSAIADGLAIALTGYFSPRLSSLSPEEKLNWIIKQFRGMSGVSTIGFGENRVSSLPDAIAKALQLLRDVGEKESSEDTTQLEFKFHSTGSQEQHFDLCPECGTVSMTRQEGCALCFNCGYSKC
ncbi:MAG: ribonucleoside-diphosphate reductase, partial [Tissierella sp.]|nr:ribonucleoside-diphosphate reductase [Tissierella sp.]